jgi:hypothetical protein
MTDKELTPRQEQDKKRAIECAMSRRSCAGCDLQHYCEPVRRAQIRSRSRDRVIWWEKRNGEMIAAEATIYQNSVVVTAPTEKLTDRQFANFVNREFPRHSFFKFDQTSDFHGAEADRFENDGLEVFDGIGNRA